MNKLRWIADNLEYGLSMLCMGTMICLLFVQVVSRYLFGYSLAFTEEIGVMLFILSVYIGAIGATRRGQHLKIELLTAGLSERGKAICGVISNIVFIVINCFLSYGGTLVMLNLMNYRMKMPITKLPKWLPYAVIPLALTLISLRLIEDTVRKARELREAGKGA